MILIKVIHKKKETTAWVLKFIYLVLVYTSSSKAVHNCYESNTGTFIVNKALACKISDDCFIFNKINTRRAYCNITYIVILIRHK